VLRGNLSTRPFYNERLVSLVLVVAAAAIVALMVFNGSQLSALSSRRGELNARIAADQAEADRIRGETARLRQTVDVVAMRRLSAEAVEANGLIDQRTFSWTTLFGVLEATLPYDVRLQSVAPAIERGRQIVRMGVIAKNEDDLYRFIAALQKTGQFVDPYATARQLLEDGTTSAVVQSDYRPPAIDAPERAASPAPGRGRGGRP
jgi:Tfp pilus assembly protein PilN